ncbi:MAG TPA: zinc-ribbon domain-containing protein [Candidatus Sulfotelmatobacter sp.]|jgi:hypothetical protein|nr:zinc-ribbon domain-containing protein [Candidatus Sulfotelmatobacter sp.]
MFCDQCGSSVQAGQAFCSSCGKPIVGPVSLSVPFRGRVQQHTQLLGILWLAFSALNVLGGFVLLVLGGTLFPHLRAMGAPPETPVGFLSALMSTLGILILAKAVCGFIAGRGLLHHDEWARTLALVLAFISLFSVPFGTALGVYTLWVLLPSDSQREYDSLAAKAA